MSRLVLFDIDGTLLSSNGAAAVAFLRSLRQVFGTAGDRDGYSFAGKTDPQIARDLLRRDGVGEELIDRRLPELWQRYLAELRSELRSTPVTVFPGVRPLLDRMEHAGGGAVLGLLTGNLVDGAKLKLEAASLDFNRFRVGAFGSDHADRHELPAIAVRRTEHLVGRRFSRKEVVIIGDTPADVACGEHLGVRTIAVCTGTFSAEQLRACRPDYLFQTLEDVEGVCEAVFG